jgi:hypothetical protein
MECAAPSREAMSQENTSRVPQDADSTAPTGSTIRGDSSKPDVQTPTVMIPSPPRYRLRFLIALITKANQSAKE